MHRPLNFLVPLGSAFLPHCQPKTAIVCVTYEAYIFVQADHTSLYIAFAAV